MKLRFLILLAPLLSAFTAAQEVKPPEKKDFHLFLLAGQSNMAGRGKQDDESRKTDPRILALNKNRKWQFAVDPLHWDKSSAGTGLGKPFATIIAEKNPGVTIGLIPTACGGSPIDTWQPGKHWGQTKSNPWDDSIAAAKAAMNDGTLKAILWHQGESDSNAANAPLHKARLKDLIERFRKELGDPDLPFIIGQIGQFPEKPWSEHRMAVDTAQQEVAKEMKNVRFVPVPDPKSIGDNLHFDTPTLRRMGKGYADAYFDIIGKR
jgi:hypothetical protein